ncbi:MAG: hypothetical protein JO339_35720, partial [Alphaproteobacteria bacterium]|nr:hypothetical protein [Alphaproteobacteria bacterium]
MRAGLLSAASAPALIAAGARGVTPSRSFQRHRRTGKRDGRGQILGRALLGAAGAIALSAGSPPAVAQSWNMYSSYSQSATLSFFNALTPPATPGSFPTLNVTMPGSSVPVSAVMDTGSTGIWVSAALLNTAGLQNLGPGKFTYTSSIVGIPGTFYQVPGVTITGNNGNTVTSNVQVLAVNDSCNASTGANCQAYMGIGFDRGGNAGYTQPTTAMNAFLNITAINGVPVTNMHPGYAINSAGVTLGLTSAQTSGFAIVKLTPNTIIPGNVWNKPNVSISTPGYPSGIAGFTPDTGIAYMIITPPGSIPSTTTCPAPAGTCATATTNIGVSLIPGLPANIVNGYNFSVGGTLGVTPAYVNLRAPETGNTLATPMSLNSGNAFYIGFNYFYDPVGGWVGYQAAAPTATDPNPGSTTTPLVAMQGAIGLPSGFSSTYSTFLLGDTQLQQTGSGSFSGPIYGLGNSLTVASGSLFFNGAIDMGGGTFLVQPGATATINSSLAASNVQIASQATLANNGLMTASLLNAGTLTNTGAIVGSLTNIGTVTNSGTFQAAAGGTLVNQGTLTNNGLLSGNVFNFGSLFNNGTVVGNVLNSGLLANNGLIQGAIANSGSLTGNGVFIGSFANSGVLNSNGTFVGSLFNSGFLGGNPTIVGSLANNGILSPGNSIGTITVVGSAALGSGTSYLVQINNAGQTDTVAVSGPATIQGGTVAVSPATGVYAPRTTYTILSSGGLSGGFGSVSSSGSQFLLPSLSYDANNAYLTMTIGGFLAVAQNPVQAAVGGALDGSVLQASGDYAQVLGNLAANNPSHVPAILTSLSGMNYSGFSNSMVQTAQLFMSNFSDMAGGTARGRNKVALAEACDAA